MSDSICGKGIVWASSVWASSVWGAFVWSNTSIYDCIVECVTKENEIISDVKLTQNFGIYDFSYCKNGDLQITNGFDTSLLMSLFCEQRASSAEVQDSIRRRGWIGNKFYNEDGFENGSKMWVHIDQGRITNDSLNSIKNASLSCLEWLISDGFAQKTNAEIVIIDNIPLLKITVEASSSKTEEKFYNIWSNTGA